MCIRDRCKGLSHWISENSSDCSTVTGMGENTKKVYRNFGKPLVERNNTEFYLRLFSKKKNKCIVLKFNLIFCTENKRNIVNDVFTYNISCSY